MRRYFRFSLRTFSVVITVIAVLLGTFVLRATKQRDAVRAINDSGGTVGYGYQFPDRNYLFGVIDPNAYSTVPQWLIDRVGVDFFHTVVRVNLARATDDGDRHPVQGVMHLPHVRCLILSPSLATDSNFAQLKHLGQLEGLFAHEAPNLSDDGIRHLADIQALTHVHINKSRITDDAFTYFAMLPNLRSLVLAHHRLSNQSLYHLRNSTTLTRLGIRWGENSIDDDGLVHLKDLQNLEVLFLDGSRVRGPGFIHLEALPRLRAIAFDVDMRSSPEAKRLLAKKPNLVYP